MARKPDYRVGALNKSTDAKANVGAAWVNNDGSITVVLEAFTVVHGGKDTIITLFPNSKDNVP